MTFTHVEVVPDGRRWQVLTRWHSILGWQSVAASATFPEVRWLLVWKERGQWCQQEILP